MKIKLNRPLSTFSLLCALFVLSPEASAQDMCSDAECAVPAAAMCQAAHPLPTGSYQDSPSAPVRCRSDCTPTSTQCQRALVVCPAARDCNDRPTPLPGGGGQQTPDPNPRPARNPSTPRTPSRPREVPADICEAGSHADPDNNGTCVCDANAVGGPLAVYQSGTRRVRRLQQRDQRGHLHVMCIIPPPAPQPTDNGPSCGNLTVCRDSCRDLQNDPSNCGSCGHACGQGDTCSQGTCVPREAAPPAPPIATTSEEAGRHLDTQTNNRLMVVEARYRPRLGVSLGFASTWYHLRDETFALLTPTVGLSLTFDRHDLEDTRWWLQIWTQVGPSWTGHRGQSGAICPAVHVDAGFRAGGALDRGHRVTFFGGWMGAWDIVPCHPPSGGIEVADGVSSLTGPEVGVSVQLTSWLYANGSFVVPVWSRFSRTWADDFVGFGVAMPRAGLQLEARW